MRPRHLAVIVFATLAAFCALYGPQPLLHVLQLEFGVAPSTASLCITLTLLPMGFAPILYGFLLERVAVRTMLAVALAALAGTALAIAQVHSFAVLLAVRLCQGMLIPAVFTALMTSIAASCEGQALRRVMSFYIAATIFGGFSARAINGFVSTHHGWRMAFVATGALLFAAAVSTIWLAAPARPVAGQRLRLRDGLAVAVHPAFLPLYGTIFCCFFVFAGMLSFLPFRLTALWGATGGTASEFRIGLMYSGYLMGIVVSLFSVRISRALGGEIRAMAVGLFCYLGAVGLFFIPSVWVLFCAMFLFCAGMFSVHSTAPGYLNNLAARHGMGKGVVNGLYLSFYYTGGAMGSYLPGFLFDRYGWNAFVGGMACVVGVALAIVLLVVRPGAARRTE
ncbi:MAG: MFS transporter [Desulfovibrionaceae bacterium]